MAWDAGKGPAVVLGAGGAARAIYAALLDERVPEVRLCNRSGDRAVALAKDLGGPVDVVPWESRTEALEHAALLVNTTTLGNGRSSRARHGSATAPRRCGCFRHRL